MGRSHELGGRSVNSRFVLGLLFFRNVEKRDGFCKAPCFTWAEFLRRFFCILRCYHWLITFPTLAFLLLCYGVENALSIANLQRTIFVSHCSHTLYFLLSILSFDLLFSHTKNHSSSFSAKKKRKKSVITFNFNSDSITQRTNDDDCSLLIKIATDERNSFSSLSLVLVRRKFVLFGKLFPQKNRKNPEQTLVPTQKLTKKNTNLLRTFSYECGFSMCVFVIRICIGRGFRITRRRNGLAR